MVHDPAEAPGPHRVDDARGGDSTWLGVINLGLHTRLHVQIPLCRKTFRSLAESERDDIRTILVLESDTLGLWMTRVAQKHDQQLAEFARPGDCHIWLLAFVGLSPTPKGWLVLLPQTGERLGLRRLGPIGREPDGPPV